MFLGLACLFLCLVTYQLYASYGMARTSAQTQVSNLALVLESKLSADLQAADRTVSEMAATISPEAMRQEMTGTYRQQVVPRLKADVHDISTASALRFFDANGDSLYTSLGGETAINISDRSFFRQLKEGSGSATVFSEVALGRFTQRAGMYVAKPVRAADGAFLGVAVTAIDLTALSEQFSGIDLGVLGAVALRRLDNGATVARYPGSVEIDNRPEPELPIRLAIINGNPTGTLAIESRVDGVPRLYGYRSVGNFPFFITAAMAESDYLAQWRRNAALLLIGALAFLAILAFAEGRRNRSETQLRRSRQRFRSLIERNNAVILQIDAQNGQILDANASACDFYGWSAVQLRAMNIQDINALPAQQVADERAAAAVANRNFFIFPHRLASGEIRSVEVHSTPIARGKRTLLVSIIHDVTELKRAEAVREEALERLQKIASRVPGVVYQYLLRPDGRSCFPFASEGMRDIYRVSPQDVLEDASRVFAAIHPDDYDAVAESIQASARDLSLWRHEYRVKFEDGTVRWLLGNASPQRESDGATLWHGFIADISERRQDEEKLQLAASVFTHSREGIMITSADGAIIEVNHAFRRITGYGRSEVLGKNPRLLSSGRQDQAFYAAMWRDLEQQGHWQGEVWNRRKSGEVYAAMQTVGAVRDSLGVTRQYVALFSDITPLKQQQEQLKRIAHFDALTGLPNRALLADRLHQSMAQAQRRNQSLAVAFLDLDGFKAVNDRHGHEAGDQLLIALAARMKQALREGDTLARLGGDEFVAVLLDLSDIESSIPTLARLLAAAAQVVPIGALELQVSASVGVTFYPQREDVDADQLLRQADQAMYQAKLAGKNRYHVFDAVQDSNIRGHHEHLDRIRDALAADEFVLYYQPKVNMRTGQVVGAEALIRWQHPQRGLLLPGEFLSVIEDHPLAVELGEWVMHTALGQMARWRRDGLELPVSVNVGAHQLQQADFTPRLHAILALHPEVAPRCLELEVLETSALQDIAQTSGVIEACRELGVTFALDDFGTGYSSLTYLKRLPVVQLKIDQSFVRDMLDDPDDLAILKGIIGLGAAFHRQVIAEGVETVEHGAMLLQMGCELAQGYGIARPMPAHDLPPWVARWTPPAAWADPAQIQAGGG